MNKYPKYKNSGVEWLGGIPEHWDIWKMSRAIKNIGSGTTPSTVSSISKRNFFRDFYEVIIILSGKK